MSVDRDDDPELPEHQKRVPAAQERDRERATDSGDEPGLRERQLAEHARYQKAVDATYQQAARDAWDKALPELRAAREEHKQRYPERVRPAAQTSTRASTANGASERAARASRCFSTLRRAGRRRS